MKMISVDSSAVLKVGYDKGSLFVQFVGGEWYEYPQVPESVFDQFLCAPSKGTFVNKSVKPHYQGFPCLSPEV